MKHVVAVHLLESKLHLSLSDRPQSILDHGPARKAGQLMVRRPDQ